MMGVTLAMRLGKMRSHLEMTTLDVVLRDLGP